MKIAVTDMIRSGQQLSDNCMVHHKGHGRGKV